MPRRVEMGQSMAIRGRIYYGQQVATWGRMGNIFHEPSVIINLVSPIALVKNYISPIALIKTYESRIAYEKAFISPLQRQ